MAGISLDPEITEGALVLAKLCILVTTLIVGALLPHAAAAAPAGQPPTQIGSQASSQDLTWG